MSKTVKIDDQVYEDLDQFRGKGETFSDALAKLLHAARFVILAKDVLGPFIPVIRSSSRGNTPGDEDPHRYYSPEARGD